MSLWSVGSKGSILQYCELQIQDFSVLLLIISKQEVDNETFW